MKQDGLSSHIWYKTWHNPWWYSSIKYLHRLKFCYNHYCRTFDVIYTSLCVHPPASDRVTQAHFKVIYTNLWRNVVDWDLHYYPTIRTPPYMHCVTLYHMQWGSSIYDVCKLINLLIKYCIHIWDVLMQLRSNGTHTNMMRYIGSVKYFRKV